MGVEVEVVEHEGARDLVKGGALASGEGGVGDAGWVIGLLPGS